MQKPKNLFQFSKREVSDAFKHALRVVKGPDLDLLCQRASLPHGRLLAITPRRIGNAPARNKIRRQLKAIFYEENLFSFGIDCFVIIKKLTPELSFDQLKQVLTAGVTSAAQRLKSHQNS